MLERRAVVERLLRDRGGLCVIPGLGSCTWDVAACGDHPLNFHMWGAMGGTAMIGLGLALARPDRRVLVLTGDGDMLMGLGSLATIGVKRPANFAIVVLDNRHYGETGMQASHTAAGVDLVKIAEGCRFRISYAVGDMGEIDHVRDLLHTGEGPIFVQAQIAPNDPPRVLPTHDGHAIKQRFMQALN
ncbi:MAG: aldehyde dehydrogenase [Rhizobiales bacterium]|nr:aldehyde dehydrogenase [Hyphomicrobiales bacterium]